MAIEVNSVRAVCSKCGTDYSRQKGYFPVSYAVLHKGVGHTHVCKDCIDEMYNSYLAQCNNAHDAVRQMCRKLDLYWSEKVYEIVSRKNTTRSMMTQYIAKINTVTYAGKSYDDTLSEEGTLWNFGANASNNIAEHKESNITDNASSSLDENDIEISEEVKAFWGPGYTPDMYVDLEQRRSYWMSRFPKDIDINIGTEALIRQICSLELDINRDRVAGRSVEKSVNALNTLLGSASLKPTQKKDDTDAELEKMPLGVGIQKWEYYRPLPETEENMKDIHKTIRNVTTWFLGHACKMVGLRNSYCKMYEDAMSELRVNHPEYDEEDDDTILNDIFGTSRETDVTEGKTNE